MKRKLGVLLVFGAALPLAVASVAWACGVLATVSLDTKVATPGQAVTATGKNYSNTAGEVTIRLNKRDGRVLATAGPTAGRINQAFVVPADLSPGWYVVLTTQYNADGTPKAGTPGRTTLRIQGSAAGAAAPVAGTPWSGSSPSGPVASAASGDSQALLTMLLAAGLSLSMLAGGWTLVSRRSRSIGSAAPLGV